MYVGGSTSRRAVLGAIPAGVTRVTPDQYNQLLHQAADAAQNSTPVADLPSNAQPFDAYLKRDGQVYVNAPDIDLLNQYLAGQLQLSDIGPVWTGYAGPSGTEEEETALAILLGADPAGEALTSMPDPANPGKRIVDPAQLARIQQIGQSSAWVQSHYAASKGGNQPSAQKAAIVSSTNRQQLIADALNDLETFEAADRGATIDPVQHVNDYLARVGQAPLTDAEKQQVVGVKSSAPLAPAAPPPASSPTAMPVKLVPVDTPFGFPPGVSSVPLPPAAVLPAGTTPAPSAGDQTDGPPAVAPSSSRSYTGLLLLGGAAVGIGALAFFAGSNNRRS